MGVEELKNTHPLWKVGIVVSVVGVVLYIVGYATPHWIGQSAGGVETYSGLFESCGKSLGKSGCDSYPSVDWIDASQAMTSIGLAFWCVGTALAVFGKSGSRQIVAQGGAALVLAGGIFGIIGGAVFAAKGKDKLPGDIAWSAILFFIACFLALVSAVLQLLGGRN